MTHDSATRILALRHGETAWNVETRIQGQLDIPLNDEGQRQAEALALALADEPIAAIYSSDLARASATAAALARRTGLALQLDAGLRERDFGAFQGRTVSDIERDEPEQSLRWRRREPDFTPAGGESLTTFYARCVNRAMLIASAHPGRTIALVAHGGVLDCLYRAACGMALQAPRSWQLGNASINRLLYTGESLTIIGWGDSAHLDSEDGRMRGSRDEVQDSRA
jgi:probable phosphoglycerate mutase